jgi:SEC-C motif-containing protein
MRSRYSAYAGGLVDYIVETTDPDGPHWREDTDGWRTELIEWCETTEFLGLRVLGSDSDSTGHWVEFEARLSASGRSHSLVERSLFVKREGRWLYREALAR